MKKYKYLIIDDDDMDRLATSFYLKNHDFLEHSASFSSPVDGLEYLDKNDVDILFLDIDMPNMSGIELLRKIEEKVLCTIFITSHSEYAIESFSLNAFDYIIKPLERERLDACVARLKEYLDIKFKAELFEYSFKKDTIMIKEGHNYVAISPFEVIYLEALKDYTKLILLNKKNAIIHGNIGAILNNENFNHFMRIHKSYAIQKKYIQAIKANEIILIKDIILPIGQIYKKNLLDSLT